MTFYFHEAYVLGRKPRAMAVIMASSAILNLVLNLILTPRLGITGAALATVIAYAVALSVCVVHGRTIFPLPIPVKTWAGAGAATGLMALALLALPAPAIPVAALSLKIVVGAGVYGLAALVLDVAGCRSFIADRLAMRREVRP
jgi:O-antigen/teichoic acid export membrane protein